MVLSKKVSVLESRFLRPIMRNSVLKGYELGVRRVSELRQG